jgi:GWxTD domain-containing protein
LGLPLGSHTSDIIKNMRRICLTAFALSLIGTIATAQGPKGADTLSPAAIADSLKVLATLDAKVRANGKDAAAWYQLGMVAWALSERAKSPNAPRELDPNKLSRMADTSLRRAAQAAPKNAYYRMTVGRYLLTSGVSVTRFASGGFFEAALDVARKGDDPAVHAETAIEFARVSWRRYDALVNRRMEITPGSAVRSLSTALNPAIPGAEPVSQPLKAVREIIEAGTMPLPPDLTGDSYFESASRLFREAYDAQPTHAKAFRDVAMCMAEKRRWKELEEFASNHLKNIPWDAWGWMTLGLATQRQGNAKIAAAAYDSAMGLLDAKERARLDRIDRVLPAPDSARLSRSSEAEKTSYGRLYWLLADPLWSQPGNESRVEYFARVTFAELRWTVDEMGVRGADTDRGEIFIRYGPPDLVAAFGPVVSSGIADADAVSTTWVYDSGLAFVFIGRPTFATSHTANADVGIVRALTQMQPVRWDNLSAPKMDSVATLVSRFRGGRDSVDVFISADPPVDSIRAAMVKAGVTVRGDLWILRANATLAFRDSAPLPKPGVQAWSHRVAPGAYLYRLEASAADATRAARSTGLIDAADNPATGVALHGPGLSDLLLATSAEPRTGTARRWTDLNLAPTVGLIPRGSPLALVWENYEFGAKDGSAQYEVVVTITRQQSTLGRIGASITGTLASVARIDHGDDRVSISFDRTVQHSAAFVDYIPVVLSDTPPGKYSVAIQITDRVSGKIMTRTRNFTIHE